MLSLQEFPALPPPGHLTLCEVEGTVHCAPAECANIKVFTTAVSTHPNISITREVIHHTPASRDELGRVFLPGEENLLKKLINVLYEDGIMEAIQSLATMRQGEAPSSILMFARFIVKSLNTVNNIRNKFNPRLRAKGEKLISTVSQTREWPLSPVRCLQWHPHTSKLAVAAWDDSVRIYNTNSPLVPILKYKNQTSITCLAWRPYMSSELAVACEAGVFVWSLDPNSLVTRPSITSARLLKRHGHSPVTCVEWNPQGDILLTSSASDSYMYLWEVEMGRSTPIRRFGGGGVCLTCWSPRSSKVFSATTGVVFRVWETSFWTPERWNLIAGRVQTACWSPCGSIVLFTTSEEPIIYSLAVGSVFCKDDAVMAKPVIDLTPIEINSLEKERVGGLVTSLAWDGHHLAVLFKESSVIAVFRTELRNVLNITQGFFINGLPGETPNCMNFQRNFEEGALLSIAWSTGRIQHFPFVYTDLDNEELLPIRPAANFTGFENQSRLYSPISPIQRPF